MAKLNQILAVIKGDKASLNQAITAFYHKIQKRDLFTGISRVYEPLAEPQEGERVEALPREWTRVQLNVDDEFRRMTATMGRLFNITAVQDYANTRAKADIVVDGHTLLEDVPVTYLLFLEKQLTDYHTIINKIPTLDPSQLWDYDSAANAWRLHEPVETIRSKKVPRVISLAKATDKHPEQVQLLQEDIQVGKWTKVDFSGAVPEWRIRELNDRVAKLMRAVKFARETANMLEVEDVNAGGPLLGYLTDGTLTP